MFGKTLIDIKQHATFFSELIVFQKILNSMNPFFIVMDSSEDYELTLRKKRMKPRRTFEILSFE